MLLPTPALRDLAGLPAAASLDEVAASAPVLAWLQDLVDRLAASATGSASRIARALVLTEPPSLDKGEITDNGSINQRAVLKCRASLVDALHAGTAPHAVIART
jgi:feruloyl-CoA synthase